MPELPELEALRLTLGPRLEGALVTGCAVEPQRAHLLRYPVHEFEREAPIRRLLAVWRRGKHLGFDTDTVGGGDPRALVVNPMLGGRFQLAEDAGSKRPAQTVFSLRLEGNRELRYFDLRDMGRIYWVREVAEVPAWADLGPEADSVAQVPLDEFRKRLRRYRDELKDLLRNQAFLAGVGNAYSDEILFEARLLPLRRRATLSPEEEAALHAAIPRVLGAAITAILANPDYDESKQNRRFMRVHAKGGEDCPRCGHRISQLGSNREPVNFCRGCQS